MSVGGKGLQKIDGDIQEVPIDQPLLFLPHSAEYCSSKINRIEKGTIGNVGIVILKLTILYYQEKNMCQLISSGRMTPAVKRFYSIDDTHAR